MSGPRSESLTTVLRLGMLALVLGAASFLILQVWATTGAEIALYLGLGTGGAAVGALVAEYITAASPGLRRLWRLLARG